MELTNITQLKWFAAFSIFLSALLAGWHLFKRCDGEHPHKFTCARAFSAGIFLGAALLHMLYSANIELNQLGINYPLAPLLAGFIFLLLLWLEHLTHEFEHHSQMNTPAVTLLATLILCIHSILEGMALGVNNTFATSVILFAAIIAHKWAAGFALACQLCITEAKKATKILLFLMFCLATPVAIIASNYTLQTHANPLLAPITNALAAGTFLYIGTLHGLNRAVMIERCCNLREFILLILGFSAMALLAVWT